MASDNGRLLKFVLVYAAIALLAVGFASADLGSSINSATTGIQNAVAKHKFSAINGAIIATLLFVIIALIAEKIPNAKQRGVLQGVALIGSFAVAFMNAPLKTGYIWHMQWMQNILHLKVIVNLLLISIFIYFVAMLIPAIRDKAAATAWGKFGLGFISFVIAANLALAPFEGGKAYDDKTYKYIWEEENLVEARFYLLGDGNCYAGEPEDIEIYTDALSDKKTKATFSKEFIDKIKGGRYCYTRDTIDNALQNKPTTYTNPVSTEASNFEGFGILRGKQLFILIGLGLLLFWFFREWKIGTDMVWLNILVSYLITSKVAHSGISVESAVFFGEILFAAVIYKAMKAQDTFKGKLAFMNVVFAVGLTMYLADMAFGTTGISTLFSGVGDIAKGGLSGLLGIVILSGIGVLIGSRTFSSQNNGVKYGGSGLVAIGTIAAIYYYFSSGASGFIKEIMPTWMGVGIGGIVLIVAVIMIVLASKKGDDHRKDAERANVINSLFEWANWKVRRVGMGIPGIKHVLEWFKLTRTKAWAGTVPIEFRQNRHLFEVLMNYMLRLEVFKNKTNTVENGKNDLDKWYGTGEGTKEQPKEALGGLGKETSIRRFRRQINLYRNGRRLRIDKDMPDDQLRSPGNANYSIDDFPWTYVDDSTGEVSSMDYDVPDENPGMMSSHRLILKVFQTIPETFAIVGGSFEGSESVYGVLFNDAIKPLRDSIVGQEKKYGTAWSKYVTMRLIEARRIWLLNQYLMFGEYEHTYRFATFSAPVYYQDYEVEEDSPGTWKIKPKKDNTGKDIFEIEGVQARFAHPNGENRANEIEWDSKLGETNIEVRFDGYYSDDWNTIIMGLNSGLWDVYPGTDKIRATVIAKSHVKYLRRVYPAKYGENITFHHKLNRAVYWNLEEWKGFVEDLMYGEYKPMSRTEQDYFNAYEKYDLLFKHVVRERRKTATTHNEGNGTGVHHNPMHDFTEVGEERPAFDEEAMKDPGTINYYGRKRWNTRDRIEIKTVNPYSPYPGLSVVGISKFILFYIEKRMKEDETVLNTLNIFSWWSKNPDHPFTTAREAKEGGKGGHH